MQNIHQNVTAFSKFRVEFQKIVAQDKERLQWASGMKVITHPITREEQLWIMTDRWPTYVNGRINSSDVNYRIMKGSVKKLIAGTNCDFPLKKLDPSDYRLRRKAKQ
ncbi:hypothetical protein QAD02_015736 [Eretmocerus hayati]|uniref:Uncharacterized protein n=1 Tax=Eretmocerus hayati TaxID=131215 RepID=A0ACC2P9H9_9HYME|nr:hypothetical protein QAD02_015736 [Eretmocerus hayati]